MSAIRRLLERAQPGSAGGIAQHIRRGERLAVLIQARWGFSAFRAMACEAFALGAGAGTDGSESGIALSLLSHRACSGRDAWALAGLGGGAAWALDASGRSRNAEDARCGSAGWASAEAGSSCEVAALICSEISTVDSFGYLTSGLICGLKMINAEVACTTSERLQHDSRVTGGCGSRAAWRRQMILMAVLARQQHDWPMTGQARSKLNESSRNAHASAVVVSLSHLAGMG